MKPLFAFFFTVVTVCGFSASAEAGILADIITYIKTNMPIGTGKIPWSAFMILLATGIIGILGIRRKGKKF